VEFDARIILGTTYDALGLEQEAKDQLEQARELALRRYGPESNVTLGTTADLVRMLARTGHVDQAEAVATEALAVATRTFGAHHYLTCRVHNSLGVALLNGRRYAQAEAIFQSLVTEARAQPGKLDHYLPSWLNNLAVALRSQGHHEQAAAMLVEVLDLLRQRDEPILRGHARRNLALSLATAGRLDEAEAAYREALSDQRRILGDDHPSTLTTATQYATLLDDRGMTEQAASLRQELTHPPDDGSAARTQPAPSHPATMPGAPQMP
jgi:tetratricopeptide (TPR) repeat protein